MPKKNWTPEEKAAFGAKMKAARAAKKELPTREVEVSAPDVVIDNLDLRQTVDTLQRQLNELLAERRLQPSQPQVAQVPPGYQAQPGFNPQGGLVGSFERYITDPAWYPDPRERLAAESRLQPFAFSFNYELTWAVSTTQYETIDNRRVKEPRFTIELVRVILDEDTGLPTNKRYVICRGIFHEDPDAALEIAARNGVIVDTSNQKAFLDEMRYLRIRDWLLEAFFPPKPDPAQNKRETVIGNKLVQVYEVSSELGQETPKIPFGDLTKL